MGRGGRDSAGEGGSVMVWKIVGLVNLLVWVMTFGYGLAKQETSHTLFYLAFLAILSGLPFLIGEEIE